MKEENNIIGNNEKAKNLESLRYLQKPRINKIDKINKYEAGTN